MISMQMATAIQASASVMAARMRLMKALEARVENQSSTSWKGRAQNWHANVHKAQASQYALPQVTNLGMGEA